MQQPGWVSEGIYLLFVDLLLEDADRILLMDIPWRTASWRIVQRYIVNTLHGTNQYPGLKLLIRLLKYARTYYCNQRPDTEETVQAFFDEYGVWTPPNHHCASQTRIV